jgi:glutathione S-transferase
MPDTLKLYYSPGACSLAPHVALEETGTAYEPVRIMIPKGEQRMPEYLAINLVAQRFPHAALWPDNLREEARCLEWLTWIVSTMHVAFHHVRRPERYAADPIAIEDVITKGRQTCHDLWAEAHRRLGAGPWALGSRYSVADPYLLVFWTLGCGPTLGFEMIQAFPHWTAHARRMAERSAVKRAFAREGLDLPA